MNLNLDGIQAETNQDDLPHDPTRMIDALNTREICKGGPYLSPTRAIEQHLMLTAGMYDSPEDRRAAVDHEKYLLELGNELHGMGYRLRKTERNTHGHHAVPDGAIIWRIVPAGYIAGSEALRLQYVIKK